MDRKCTLCNKEVLRRTFEAEKYPKGSEERQRLNCDPVTSEYLHGERYIVRWPATLDNGTPNTGQAYRTKGFKTKREAEEYAAEA